MKRDKDYYLSKVIALTVAEKRGAKVHTPGDVVGALEPYGYADQECFVVVLLDGAQQIIDIKLITKGLVNRTLCHPREVFRPAIVARACAVVLAHNHPSGTMEPSREDDEATKRIKDAGKVIGIEVLDHVIVGNGKYYSYKEQGRI